MEKIGFFGIVGLVVASCASTPTYEWPKDNPFQAYRDVPLTSYSGSNKGSHLHQLELLFSSNVFGETDPCGCASGPKGGLDRRLNFIKMTPAFGDRLVLDAGNSLFATEQLDPSRKDVLLEKAKAVLYSHNSMDVRAVNIGYLDLSGGVDFLRAQAKKLHTPFVSASIVSEKPNDHWFEPYVDLQVATLNVRVTGLTSGRGDLNGLTVRGPKEALSAVLPSKDNVDLYIVLSDLGRVVDEDIMNNYPGVPMVIIGSRDLNSLDHPIVKGNKILVQPQFRGQQWGQLKMNWDRGSVGWFNLGNANELSDLWSHMVASREEVMKRPADSERNGELRGQADAAREIMEQGPPSPGQTKIAFDYELIDLGSKYMKTNELSKKMKELNAL